MAGRLFYLMGPSGSGKDSLLRACREQLAAQACLVAPRWITRAAELEGENHLALSAAEFAQRVQLGTFALHWHANGHSYGIGVEIDQWLASGIDVLVNGSRSYLPEARKRYGAQLLPLLVQVDPQVLRQRLLARGRESEQQIAERVARSAALLDAGLQDAWLIDNNSSLQAACQQLLRAVATHDAQRQERVGER